ncbi:hypothetical protein MTO98_26655 [Mucilaginibacter sp. SMC90]|uniref:hypothetical protein n=1 Tax=Mucilaginibacter sp. SMC90 TaxID=2929803 RepID=UPI001FB51DDE|nr:hypothetical protein [Mucilaginibacter sp. SMC90]UOE47996.1 hypothetical protein MTO98_26655 [Mucilaginibacter sp. SMC90]
MNSYTIETLKTAISDYFHDFFSPLLFKADESKVVMRGFRYDYKCEYIFLLDEINSLAYSFHHRLESIKGDFIRNTVSTIENDNGKYKFAGCRISDTQYSIDKFSKDVIHSLIKEHVDSTGTSPKKLLIDWRNYDQYLNNKGTEKVFIINRHAGQFGQPLNIKVEPAVADNAGIVEFKY